MPDLLAPDAYSSVSSFFEEAGTSHLAVASVLAGTLPGRIVVDDPERPASAVLAPANHYRIYVGGEPSAPLLSDAIHLIHQPALAERYWFMLHYPSDAWKPTIERVLQGLGWSLTPRYLYHLREPAPTPSPLQGSITIAAIDRALVDDTSLENRDELIEEIHSESPSLEYFLREHFGYCALDGRQLVGWCLAEYHEQRRYELGIGTIEGYQRRGIATHVAAAVIQRAFAEGAEEIGWHCRANNAPSIATAVKLGFQRALEYPVIVCDSRLAPSPDAS